MRTVKIDILRVGDHQLPDPYVVVETEESTVPHLQFVAYRYYSPEQCTQGIPQDIVHWRTFYANAPVYIPSGYRVIVDTGFSVYHPKTTDWLLLPSGSLFKVMSLSSKIHPEKQGVLVELCNDTRNPLPLCVGDEVARTRLFSEVMMLRKRRTMI